MFRWLLLVAICGCTSSGLRPVEWATFTNGPLVFSVTVTAIGNASYADAVESCVAIDAQIPTEPEYTAMSSRAFDGLDEATGIEWYADASGAAPTVFKYDSRTFAIDGGTHQFRCSRHQ